MNYKTQLNAWAMEMALKFYERKPETATTLGALFVDTNLIVDFAYNPQKDFEDHAKDLFEMIRKQEDPVLALNQIVGTLEYMREDIEANSKLRSMTPANSEAA